MPEFTRFIRPVDVLFFRGNRLFGEAGSFGESHMPPPPSVAAGALRSALMAERGIDPAEFAAGRIDDPDLGRVDAPGTFRLLEWHLARHDGRRVTALHRPPADLVVKRDDQGELRIERMQPTPPPAGVYSSSATDRLAVLPETARGKPAGGYWLDEAGWAAVLAGKVPAPENLVEQGDLWREDVRTGVGLDPATRGVEEGKLFASQAIAPAQDGDKPTGFVARVRAGDWPAALDLRLGGDGRAAVAEASDWQPPRPDLDAIAREGRARLILTSPGLFPEGWRPGQDGTIEAEGLRARITCAAVSRAETISGFDLAHRRPKPAQRVAPTGSVYWLDDLQASPEALGAWLDAGLWPRDNPDPARRAEGYNRFTLARL